MVKSDQISSSTICLDDTVCRVCLHAKGLASLFDGLGLDTQFTYCTQLAAEKDDGLPGKLCNLCMDHLRIAYDFCFQATYAEKLLRRKTFFLSETKDSEEEQIILDENLQKLDTLMTEINGNFDTLNETKNMLEGDSSDSEAMSDHFSGELAKTDAVYNIPLRNLKNVFEQLPECNISSHLPKDLNPAETITPQILPEAHENTKNTLSSISSNKCKQSKRKNGNIQCNICGTTFTTINSMKQHLLKHSGERPFKCEFCEKTFTRQNCLTIHRRLHTGQMPYNCNECIRKFVTREAMQRHQFRDHKSDNESAVCNQLQSSKCSFLSHKSMQHERKSRQRALQKHKSDRSNWKYNINKPRRHIGCKICQRGFPSKWELEAHQDQHQTTQLFKCLICKQTFQKKFKLLYHLQTHDNADILITKSISSATKIYNNISSESCNEDDDKPLVERVRASKRLKKLPIPTTNQQLPNNKTVIRSSNCNEWKCQLCHKIFTNIGLLKVHIRFSHSGKEPFSCLKCGKTFVRNNLLQLHEGLHVKGRPYKCLLCNENIITKDMILVSVTVCNYNMAIKTSPKKIFHEFRSVRLLKHAEVKKLF